jgi:hypothetical protein
VIDEFDVEGPDRRSRRGDLELIGPYVAAELEKTRRRAASVHLRDALEAVEQSLAEQAKTAHHVRAALDVLAN